VKADLRREAAARRREAYNAEPDAPGRLAAAFPPQLMPRAGQIVSGYRAFRTELDPLPLLTRLAETGASLCLPVTPPMGDAVSVLTFRAWSLGDALEPSAFGVMEPLPEKPVLEPDILLVPLLAFDSDGIRLGYGAGHYDRTIARLRALKPIIAIGIAYGAQCVPHLPADPWDQSLDWIVTPDRAYEVGKAS
jgi:5-formyltetrahydrofolate cyclo-ligase